MVLGIILLVSGLVGLLVKAERYQVHRQSYTGHPLLWAPWMMILIGVLLIVSHF